MKKSTTAPPDCPLHEVPRLGYLGWHDDDVRRDERGERQRECPQCHRWVWQDLFHADQPEPT